jgi:hypothetical protein
MTHFILQRHESANSAIVTAATPTSGGGLDGRSELNHVVLPIGGAL